jgi:hypothetical protein
MPGWKVPDLIVVRPSRLNFVLETYVRLPFCRSSHCAWNSAPSVRRSFARGLYDRQAYFVQLTWWRSRKNGSGGILTHLNFSSFAWLPR